MVAQFTSAADYYVSASATGPGTGTLGDPFATIQEAADVMVAGDTCYIRAGTYRETIVPANSGTAGNPITYQAYLGETVVITGLESISGWTQHSGSIYKANLSWSLDHEDQVFVVDGSSVTYLWEARWPNITEYTFPGLRGGFAIADSGSVSTLVDNALNQANDYWNGATVWYIGGIGGWLAKTSEVSDFNGGTGTLTLANTDTTSQDPTNGSEYFLSGILGELDAENEWYIDAGNQEIYLWAPGGGVPNNIEVKSRLEGMIIQNKSYINLEGIDFLAANIQLNNADYCNIDGINARYIYGSDKSLGYGASNQRDGGINVVGDHNTIQNSELSYTTGSMIQLNGTGNQVVNNHIHHTTMLGNYASAILFDRGDTHLISHNTIHDMGRCAFSSTNEVNKSIIQHNRIHDFMWLSSDGAAFYVWGMDMGNTEIRYNIISDGHGVVNGWGHKSTHGIYMDNGVNNVLIHHNVVYDVGDSTSHGLRFNQPGDYRIAYNNTILDNTGLSFDTKPNGNYDPNLFGCVLNNNILTDGATQDSGLLFEDNITATSGLNMVDPANHDYRLNAGSTAIDHGSDDSSISDNFLTGGLGYEGSAPDAGAYEYGATDWTAGHDFNNPPIPDFTLRTSRHMNLLIGSGFDVLDDWSTTGSPTITNFDLNKSGLRRGFRKWLQLNGSTGEGVEQTVTGLKPNSIYMLSGWVFCDAGEEIRFGVKDYGDIELSQTATNTAYDTRRDIFFTTGATDTEATVFINKSSTGSGNVYADDFGLVEQIFETVLIDEDFASGLGDWTVTDTVTADASAQSPFRSGVGDNLGALFMDDAGTNSRLDQSMSVADTRSLYIQFDYFHTASAASPGVQVLKGNTKGLNLQMSGGAGSIQYNDDGTWTSLSTSLVADTWYRLTLSVLPIATADDQFDLRVQSLDSSSPLDVTYNGLGFQGDLDEVNTLRFHYNISPSLVGGEYRIDNVLVTTSTEELNFEVDAPLMPVFEDAFGGTSINSWWTYSFTSDGTPHDAGSQNDVLTFSRPVPSESYYFGRDDDGLGTVSNVCSIKFEVSNHSITSGTGTPFFRVSSEATYFSGINTAMQANIETDGLYHIFLNNSFDTLAYNDGDSLSGSLSSQTYAVYRDGILIKSGFVDPSGTLGDDVAVDDPLTSLGWGIFGNNDAIISFDIDNFELYDTLTLGADVSPFDSFASTYGLSGDPLADFDSDGITDYEEYVFGGLPNDATNKGMLPSLEVSSGEFIFHLIGDESVTAHVLISSDLLTWTAIRTESASGPPDILSSYSEPINMGATRLFVRLGLEIP